MYLVTTKVKSIVDLTLEEAKLQALIARGLGYRSEILTYEEAKMRGLFENMQDLTQVKDWESRL